MPVEAHLADGTVLQFPDGTDPGIVQNTVKKHIAGQPSIASQTRYDTGGGLGKGPTGEVTSGPVNSAGDTIANQPHGALEQIGDSISNTVSGVGGLFKQNVEHGGQALDELGAGNYGQAAVHAAAALSPAIPVANAGAGMIAAQWDQARQAKEAYDRGDYGAMTHHALGAAVPIAGPMIENAADKISAGRGVEAATDIATQAILAKGVPYALGKLGPLVKNANTGAMESALQSSETGYIHDRAGNLARVNGMQGTDPIQAPIRLTAGERTGSQATQSLEQKITGQRAQKFYQGQKEDMANRAQAIAEQVSPQDTDAYGAGQALQSRLRGGINNLRAAADQDYNDVRAAAATNPVDIQVGETPGVPGSPAQMSKALDANGQPFQVSAATPGTPGTPIYKTMHSPVDLQDYQSAVKPIYDELEPGMTDAQKSYSPAWQSLKDVMGRNMSDPNQRYMDPMLFDKHLGALKAITRGGKSDMLSTQGQGLAQQLLKNGESTLADGLGPDAMQSLAEGRAKVAAYYSIDHELQALPKEPGALSQMFGRKNDVMADQLTRLNQVAPEQVQGLGRRVLESMLEGSTKEGQFNPTKTLSTQWSKLGPRTKEIFYGKAITQDIDKFMMTAERASHNYQPSGSVRSVMDAAPIGYAALKFVEAGGHMVSGNPLLAGKAVAQGVGGAAVAATLPKLISRLLFTPGGADLLTNAFKSKPGTPQFFNAVAVLNTTLKNQQNTQDNQALWKQATGGGNDE